MVAALDLVVAQGDDDGDETAVGSGDFGRCIQVAIPLPVVGRVVVIVGKVAAHHDEGGVEGAGQGCHLHGAAGHIGVAGIDEGEGLGERGGQSLEAIDLAFVNIPVELELILGVGCESGERGLVDQPLGCRNEVGRLRREFLPCVAPDRTVAHLVVVRVVVVPLHGHGRGGIAIPCEEDCGWFADLAVPADEQVAIDATFIVAVQEELEPCQPGVMLACGCPAARRR